MNRFLAFVFTVLTLSSCAKETAGPDPLSVAVFVPGVASGSPTYEMLVAGATKAVAETEGASIKIIEAGYDQATWMDRLRDTVASGEFGVVVSSNPSLPELCAKVSRDYPAVRFIIADAYLSGHPAIHTVLYNQKEQGYLVGYLAGLVTKERSPGKPPVAGLIAAQRYPTLDKLIRPGFEAGLRAVDPDFRLEYREIGNWYDSAKAAELAAALYGAGVEVILPIAGSAGQGVVSVADERGASVVWFDGAGYRMDPDTVIGCATIAQDKLVYERLKSALGGDSSRYGTADIVSIRGGYVGFDPDGPGYANLPESIRLAMTTAIGNLAAGTPDFSFDTF
ncbi:MAG: BMP family ABC transporter substrate-binding protein [Spirochaetales bacterium]|nr:BMP family ABC transporter substrate-binding protein [Spirochaetales bacterium]